MQDATQKNIFVILGMARSGTSVITRALKALGIDLGNQFSPANEKWNPKGFWEDKEIVYQINAKIFETLDIPSYTIRLIEPALLQDVKLTVLQEEVAKLLQERFQNTSHWGFKDPSTVKLLPFWQSAFQRLALNDHYIIALRNPLSVAQSYQRLTGATLEIGLLLWMMHLFPAIEQTHGKKRVVVSYDAILQNPQHELERIRQQLAILALPTSSERDIYVNEFLDRKLHHYENNLEHLKMQSFSPLCVQLYDILLKLAKDELGFEDAAFLTEWSAVKKELDRVYPLYCYVDTLLKDQALLKNELKTIRKSILWKLISPLRKVDDYLRDKRHKKRAKNRLRKAYG